MTGHNPAGDPSSRSGRSLFRLSVATGAGAAVGASTVLGGGEPIEGALVAAFCSVFVALALIDIEHGVIPNTIVYPAMALALTVSGAWPDREAAGALVGGLGALGFGVAIGALSAGGLGGGDVKMATLVGAVVGYPSVLTALLIAAFGGGVVAAVVATRPRGVHATIPYAPFLASGALAVLAR